MLNRRKLLIGGVGLIRGRVREAGPIMVELCEELEPILLSIGYLEGSSFQTVSLIIKFGMKKALEPEYSSIDTKNSELPVSVELEMNTLRRMSRDYVKREFKMATLLVLIDIGRKYNLPHQELLELYDRISNKDFQSEV